MAYKSIGIFDLDGTVVDSEHRTPNHPDGTLNLEAYFANKTRENIFKDGLLPLARVFWALKRRATYLVVCTARTMNQDDHDFLAEYDLVPHKVLSRDEGDMRGDGQLKVAKLSKLLNLRQFKPLPVVMFDDAAKVRTAVRGMGVPVLNAVTLNQRLQKGYVSSLEKYQ